MKQRNKLLFILSVLVLLSFACSIPGRSTAVPVTPMPAVPKTGETKEPEPTDPPETQPPPTSIPKNKTSTLEITNVSGQDIGFVYIAASDDDDWGDDWLNEDVISDGETYQITGVPDGVYDLQAADLENFIIQELWTVEVKGTFTWLVEFEVALEIYNYSTKTITEIYIAPSDSETWGDDWLAGDEIAADEYYYFTGMDAGLYDIKAVDADGKVIETIYDFELLGPDFIDIIGKTVLPDNAVLRFDEDFSDNRNSWGESENDNVRYNPPTNGEFCIDIKTNNLIAWEWYEPFRPDEFVAEVACNIPFAPEDSTCGLGFGPDGDNLYWFEVSPVYQWFKLNILLNDEWQESLIPQTTSLAIYPDGWNYLSLQRLDGIVSVYINSVLVGEVTSDHFPTGRIGLGGATYDLDSVTVCLDDLRVWRLE